MTKAVPRIDSSSAEGGQSLVEMTLMMAVLMMLLLGVLDLGRMYFTLLALQDAAMEGAAYGAVHPTWHSNADNADPNNITYRTQHESPAGLIDWSSTMVDVNVPDLTPGNPIAVTVTYSYTLLTPLIGRMVGSQTLPLGATVTQAILSDEP